MNEFHQELYPTPLEAIELMNLECEGKVILEPHGGFGHIVDYCKNNGAKEVLTIEINERCQAILKSKCKIIGTDFFDCKPEEISHINAIYMNPPFSNVERHIMHAWTIAPEGCEIVSLCNYETIEHIRRFPRLGTVISQYGNTENLGDCFSNAERKTVIDIGLIRLFKPVTSSNFEFEGFFMEEDEKEEDQEGIMQYNEVRALVNRYVFIMKSFDNLKEQLDNLNYNTKEIGLSTIGMEIGYNKGITNKADFSKIIQKQSWDHVFKKMNLEKYVTSGVMRDINKFVETQTKIPFTMKNIYKMLQIIVGTRQQTFDKALEEAIDNFTKYSHENRFGVSGWKTNSGYMLNRKFIVEGISEISYGGKLQIRYDSYGSRKIDDLIKVVCNLIGEDYNVKVFDTKEQKNKIVAMDLYNWHRTVEFESNKWFEFRFFEVKFFKKGTMHIKFKYIENWYILNQAYGKLKGFSLPEEYKK
jgi:hypothetical protein